MKVGNRVFLQTGIEGWQIECWKLARLGKRFEVKGYQLKHLLFFDEIRAAYHYALTLYPHKVEFMPLEDQSSVEQQRILEHCVRPNLLA